MRQALLKTGCRASLLNTHDGDAFSVGAPCKSQAPDRWLLSLWVQGGDIGGGKADILCGTPVLERLAGEGLGLWNL